MAYNKLFYWSQDDNAFITNVPALPGCMADGDTIDESLKNADVMMPKSLVVKFLRKIFPISSPPPQRPLMWRPIFLTVWMPLTHGCFKNWSITVRHGVWEFIRLHL